MFKQSEEISEISKLINFTILFQLLIFSYFLSPNLYAIVFIFN